MCSGHRIQTVVVKTSIFTYLRIEMVESQMNFRLCVEVRVFDGSGVFMKAQGIVVEKEDLN